MSKYEPLWLYFDGKVDTELELSFTAIQSILGFPIDHAFLNYKKELLEHGYQAKKIYLKEKRVVFEKVNKSVALE